MPDPNQLAAEGGDNQQQQPGNEPDWRTQYEHLRPEYTRATQELSEHRQRLSEYESIFEALSDPETQAQALELLGFEMDTGSGQSASQQQQAAADEWVDPLEQEIERLRGQVDELTSARELEADEREAQQLIEMRDTYIGDFLTHLESELSKEQGSKVTFSPKEESVLGNLAIAMADENGVPDVQGAYDELFGQDGIAAARRQAPRREAYPAPGGRPRQGTKPDLSTRQGRAQFIDERIRAAQQDY